MTKELETAALIYLHELCLKNEWDLTFCMSPICGKYEAIITGPETGADWCVSKCSSIDSLARYMTQKIQQTAIDLDWKTHRLGLTYD